MTHTPEALVWTHLLLLLLCRRHDVRWLLLRLLLLLLMLVRLHPCLCLCLCCGCGVPGCARQKIGGGRGL
jgi:hypothetical protein